MLGIEVFASSELLAIVYDPAYERLSLCLASTMVVVRKVEARTSGDGPVRQMRPWYVEGDTKPLLLFRINWTSKGFPQTLPLPSPFG